MKNEKDLGCEANDYDHPATANQPPTPNSEPPLLGVHRFVLRLLRFCPFVYLFISPAIWSQETQMIRDKFQYLWANCPIVFGCQLASICLMPVVLLNMNLRKWNR